MENEPEGGLRCAECFRLRLEASAKKAKEQGFDYFTTTLTISPLKNAALLNEIGAEMGEKYGVNWLYSDFKKKEGYKRSIELSREFDLYRQNYCGCVFSNAPGVIVRVVLETDTRYIVVRAAKYRAKLCSYSSNFVRLKPKIL